MTEESPNFTPEQEELTRSRNMNDLYALSDATLTGDENTDIEKEAMQILHEDALEEDKERSENK